MTANVLDFDGPITSERLDDPAPNRALTCEVCGKDLTYGGRGRKPRFCDAHKPGRTDGPPKKRPAQLETLRSQLQESFAGIGAMVYLVNQFDGSVLLAKSEATANSLILLAERDPKIRRALQAAMSAQSYLQLAMVLGTVAIPIAWNHGLVKGVLDETTGKYVRNSDLAPVMFQMAGLSKMGPSSGGDDE